MKKIINSIKSLVDKKIVYIVFLVAVCSGLFWNHQYFFKPVPEGDELQYACIANTILEEGRYTDCGYTVYREPVYPLFIAGVYLLTDSHPDSVRYIQLLVFGAICLVTFLFARKYFERNVAIFSSLFLALWWALANYTGRYTRELLMALLLVILVFVILKFREKFDIKYIVLAGILLGILVLLNSVTQFLIIFFAINLIFVYKKVLSPKQLTLYLLTLVMVFALTISPWIIRNKEKYDVLGVSAVPTSGLVLSIRAELMEALYPNMPKYFFGHMFGYYFAEKLWPDLNVMRFRRNNVLNERNDLLEAGRNIFEVDNLMASEAKKKILEQPHKYILMSALDFINLNSPLIPQRIFGGNSYAHYTFAEGRISGVSDYIKGAILLAFRLWWYVVLFLVGYGIFHAVKDWNRYGWIILVILYFNMVYSAVHAIPRYISPVYPFYAILAFYGFMILYKNNKLPILKYKKDEK